MLFRARFIVTLLLLLPFATASSNTKDIIELDYIVAIVNQDVITASELAHQIKLIKSQFAQKKAQLPPEHILQKQVLERLIINQLQLQRAKRHGIRVSDEQLNRFIENLARQNRLDLDGFRQIIERDGYSFTKFREDMRNDIIINQLQKRSVENQIFVSEQEVENQLATLTKEKAQNTEYHLGHILIALPEAANPEQIAKAKTQAEQVLNRLRTGADFEQTAFSVSSGQNALQGGDLGWLKRAQLPTIFAEMIPKMQKGEYSEVVRSSSGFHIIKLIDQRDDQQQHIVTQTLARHILVKTDQITSDDDAKSKLTRIKERLDLGGDFGKLAQANSDDTGSSVDGGNLGWTNPGDMVPEFESEMAKLAPGQISEPFRSRFGWHIVQVMSRREHDNTAEFQRNQARRLIQERKYNEELQTWIRRMRDEAFVEYRLNQ